MRSTAALEQEAIARTEAVEKAVEKAAAEAPAEEAPVQKYRKRILRYRKRPKITFRCRMRM